MKIWFLTTEFPPYYGGGIGTYMQHATNMFARAGHEVTVVLPGKESIVERVDPGITVARFCQGSEYLESESAGPEPDDHPAFPYNIMSHWPALSYQMANEVGRLAGVEGPPDVIEVQDYGGLGYYLLQKKLLGYPGLAGIPVLLHMHAPNFELLPLNEFPSGRLPEYWVGRMEKFSILAADGRLCPSRFLKQRATATITGGRGDLEIDVAPLPFSPPAAPPPEIVREDKTIVYVGRLQLMKGVLPLVDCCERLWREGERFKLVMVGADTEYYAKGISVGEYIGRRYRHRVEQGLLEMTGNLPPEQCARHVAGAWAAVVPSHYENFPLTCVEAMHAGKVVIASSSGGQSEMIVDEDCGFLFHWDRPGSLDSRMKEVLGLSPQENKAVGERARVRINDLTGYQNVLPRRIEVFEKVIARAGGRKIFPSVNQFEITALSSPLRVVSRPGLLSVVIPYYNMGPYIDDALESALSSTYSPMEIIIVNDGSTDSGSLDKLREIESAGRDGVRVLHIENRGLASVRNFGAEQARGEFLAFLDSDDMVEPDYYARCIDVLKRYDNVSLVYSWVRYFEAANGCFVANNLEFPFLLAHNMAVVVCVLKRADFLAFARNNPDMSYGLEDYEGWISLYESGRLGVCIPEMLARYRVRANSMLRSMNDNQILYMYDTIVRRHPESFRRYGEELFRLLNANGASFGWNTPGENWQSAEMRLRIFTENFGAVEESARQAGELANSAEREKQLLLERVAALEWAEQRVRYLSDPAHMGLKTSLRGLVYGIRRKTLQLLKIILNPALKLFKRGAD